MDKGREWYESIALARICIEGEVLVGQVERWDREEWLRWMLESNNFWAPQMSLHSLGGLSNETRGDERWPEWLTEFSVFDIILSPETSWNISLCAVELDFNLSFTVGTDEICLSNVFLYNERRYCSR